jgi:hypothetical protein
MAALKRLIRGAGWLVPFAVLCVVVSSAPVFASPAPRGAAGAGTRSGRQGEEASPLPSDVEMEETLELIHRLDEQRRRQLEAPAAVADREASREAFSGIGAERASALLGKTFPAELEALEADPARALSDERIVRTLGGEGAVLASEGRRELLEGPLPVRAENDQGEMQKVDLSLEETAAGWEPANPLVDLSLPEAADEGVEVGDHGLVVSQGTGAQAAAGEAFGDLGTFYPEVELDTDMLIVPIGTGVELFDQLRAEDSPEVLRFQVHLPKGATLRKTEAGAEVLAADGSRTAFVPMPTAVDAEGSPVPVETSVEGEALVARVPHRGADFAYPILLDPTIEDWYWHNWYEGDEAALAALENGAWTWNTSEGSSSSYVYGSTSCIFKCWGSERGLYMSTPSGVMAAKKWGQWSYSAPNSDTHIVQAWIDPFYREEHTNCPHTTYPEPYDYDGLWSTVGGWNETIQYNRTTTKANNLGFAVLEKVSGDALIIGMGTSSEFVIPCWRDVLAGGVEVWLEDENRPALTTSSSSQWMDASPIRLAVSATDIGLGVKKFEATATNSSGKPETWLTEKSCLGTYASRCPNTWNLGEPSQPQLTYSPASLPEGIDTLKVTAYDASLKPSVTTNEMTLRVDHAAPSITVSGTLTEQATLGTELPRYTVAAKALDGDPSSKENSKARSGVSLLEIEVDGKAVMAPFAPTCAGTANCGAETELEVPASELSAGSHTLKVKATDAVGHVATKSVSFSTGDSKKPTLSVSGLPPAVGDPTYMSLFGEAGSGPGQLSHPADVALDAVGDLLVVDYENDRVERFNQQGEYLGEFGEEGSGAGQFNEPTSIATDGNGNVWVADTKNNRIEKLDEEGSFLSSFGTSGTGKLNRPESVAVAPNGNVWVADRGNFRLVEFGKSGEYIRAITTASAGIEIGSPTGIGVGPDGRVWAAAPASGGVLVFSETGTVVDEYQGTRYRALCAPASVEVDAAGYAWVGDECGERVEELSPTGDFVTEFGSPTAGEGYASPSSEEGEFDLSSPMGVAVGVGSVWVTDGNNNRVERFQGGSVSAVGRNLGPIEVTAGDSGWGVTSVKLELSHLNGNPEVIAQETQSCPKGKCSLEATFTPDLGELAPGVYRVTVVASDAAGNTQSTLADFLLAPHQPALSLSGLLEERDGETLGAASGELHVKAADPNLVGAGISQIRIEREHQIVARYNAPCADGCSEFSASYHYDAARDGAQRLLQSTATPSGAQQTSLAAVACASMNSCVAVGYYKNSSSTIVPLAERWDGIEWTTLSPVVPSGAVETRLEGLSCSSETSCTAVGYYQTGTEAFSTLVERWNGTTWSTVTSPNASGRSRSYLYDVSCTGSSDCWAVGKGTYKASEESATKEPSALLEHWNGTAWSVSSATSPPTQLQSVSCASSTSCVAVSGKAGAAVQRWNGTSWSAQTGAGLSSTVLHDVACTSASACTAVGSSSAAGHTAPFAERWNGTSWAAQTSADPVGTLEEVTSGSFESVACSSSACSAVGSRSTASETMPLDEGWDGSSWALQPVAAPSGTTESRYLGASCPGEFKCMAVGYFLASQRHALAASEVAGKGNQSLTVEAVDRFGNASSDHVAVDVHDETEQTPECAEGATALKAAAVVKPAVAVEAIEASLPTAVAPSESTTDTVTEEEVDPSLSKSGSTLKVQGTQTEGEASVDPEGGFSLNRIACISPNQTTSAATEATVVNGDAAVFANTAPETDTVIRPTADGTAVIQSLRGSGVPKTFSWTVEVTPEERLVELPDGGAAIVFVDSELGPEDEVMDSDEPASTQTAESLNSAAAQLDSYEYEITTAETQTNEEVVAVLSQPWVVLKQGSVIPLDLAVQPDKEVATEYTVSYTLPTFEPNVTPEAVATEATASASSVHRCLEGSPCGQFDAPLASTYAEKWGDPPNDRNPMFYDFGPENCTNFLSQIMLRGGMTYMRRFIESEDSWWYHNEEFLGFWKHRNSKSWSEANKLPRHLWQYGLAIIDPSNQPSGWTQGDILAEDAYDENGKGDFNHLQFVVATQLGLKGREPLIANESQPESANYSRKPWFEVLKRIDKGNPEGWNRVPLTPVHTIGVYGAKGAKKHDPDNLYGPSGVFQG